jgi:hypothetical protein
MQAPSQLPLQVPSQAPVQRNGNASLPRHSRELQGSLQRPAINAG